MLFEEIDMYEDAPDDVATEKLFEACYQGTALGRPILGTEETLKTFDSAALHHYMAQNYHPEDTVVALSGHFTDADLQYICKLFERMMGSGRNQIEPAQYQSSVVVRPKDIEQNHLCLGFRGLALLDDRRYAYQLMNGILGGGMSFQIVSDSARTKWIMLFHLLISIKLYRYGYVFHLCRAESGTGAEGCWAYEGGAA